MDVQFNNVQITIRAESAAKAYERLGQLLESVEMFVSDTYSTWETDNPDCQEWSEDRDTCELWPDAEESLGGQHVD